MNAGIPVKCSAPFSCFPFFKCEFQLLATDAVAIPVKVWAVSRLASHDWCCARCSGSFTIRKCFAGGNNALLQKGHGSRTMAVVGAPLSIIVATLSIQAPAVRQRWRGQQVKNGYRKTIAAIADWGMAVSLEAH